VKLLWRGLRGVLRKFLAGASDHVLVVAPFLQPDVLADVLPSRCPATVVTSWRCEHLRSGISSLDVYDVLSKRGDAALYIDSRLHMKVYARDLTRADNSVVVGSANVTRPGLDDGNDCNHEVLCQLDAIGVRDRAAIERVVLCSTLVDDAIYGEYRQWLVAVGEVEPPAVPPPEPVPHAQERFLVTDLPLADHPSRLWQLLSGVREKEWWEEDALVHDLALFAGDDVSSEEELLGHLRTSFFAQPFVRAFLATVDEEGVFFGRVKEWVQKTCEDVPTPRRRELTCTVQALLNWIVALAPETFEIARPRHSECLRRRVRAGKRQ